MIYKTLLLFFLITIFAFAQEITRITVIEDNVSSYVPAYNFEGSLYIDAQSLAEALEGKVTYKSYNNQSIIEFAKFTLTFTAKNPFVNLTSKITGDIQTFQLTTSTHLMGSRIFIPIRQSLEIISLAYTKPIVIDSPYRILVINVKEKKQNFITHC
jgi:hypothetical protein